jgi:hypothetical protein
MFNALFFCFLPLEIDLKSFESEVPIPKDAINFNDHHERLSFESDNHVPMNPTSSHCFLSANALSTVNPSE